MTRAWRRTCNTARPSSLYLVSAVYAVASTRLALTFNNVVKVTAPIGYTNLVVRTGTNTYYWFSTFSVSGKVVTCRMVLGIGGPGPARLTYNATPAVIVDGQGRLWGAGQYRLTVSP